MVELNALAGHDSRRTASRCRKGPQSELFVKAVLETFPGAEIVAYRKRAPAAAATDPGAAGDDDEDEGDAP